MADNTTLPGTGDVIADEDIGGVKFQKMIVGWGPAGTYNKTDNTAAKAFPVQVFSSGYASIVSFTCGTVAYAANDAVGVGGGNAALTFANIGAGAGEYLINSAELEIDTAALISGETNYLLCFYSVTPPSALADSAAWDLPSGDRVSFLGSINLGTPVDLGSTLYAETHGIAKQITLASSSVFAYLVSVGAYTPTARVFKLTLHATAI